MCVRRIALLATLGLAFLAAACRVEQTPVSSEAAGEDEDSAGDELSAKASGITIWVDPVARPIVRYNADCWLVEGRASKNLDSVFAFSSDDEFGEAVLVSKRKFEIVVDATSIPRLLKGYPLFLQIEAASGSQRSYFASFILAPRFERFAGSSKIFGQKTVTPFVFGDDVRYRQTVSLAKGYDGLAASTPAGLFPAAVAADGSARSLDWTSDAIIEVAHDPAAAFSLTAAKGSTTVSKSIGADFVITDVGVSTQNAFDAWPEPACAPEVLSCLQALPEGQLDRSSCGGALDVLACRNLVN